MKKFILTIFTLFLSTSFALCATTKAYDKYGSKTGSYRTNGSVTTSYDRYGRKIGLSDWRRMFAISISTGVAPSIPSTIKIILSASSQAIFA